MNGEFSRKPYLMAGGESNGPTKISWSWFSVKLNLQFGSVWGLTILTHTIFFPSDLCVHNSYIIEWGLEDAFDLGMLTTIGFQEGLPPRYICWDSEREKGEHPLGDVSGELLYSGVRVALQPANNKGRTLFCEKDPKGTCLYIFGLMNAYDSYANSWILDRYEPCQAASSKTCPNFYAKRSQRSTRASPRKSSHKTQSDSPKMPLVCTSFLHMSQPSPHVGPKTSQNCTSMEYRTGSCRLQTAAPCDNYFLGAGGALSHGLECFPGFYTSSLSLGLCGVAESIFSLTP